MPKRKTMAAPPRIAKKKAKPSQPASPTATTKAVQDKPKPRPGFKP